MSFQEGSKWQENREKSGCPIHGNAFSEDCTLCDDVKNMRSSPITPLCPSCEGYKAEVERLTKENEQLVKAAQLVCDTIETDHFNAVYQLGNILHEISNP